jgi:hypothetical protein
MSPTLTRPPASPARAKPGRALLPGLIALLAVYVLLAQTLRIPAVVPRLTVVNPHDWWATVDVTDGGRHGWVRLLGVDRNDSRELREVFDQGERWVFRFSYGYIDGGEMSLTREQLAAANWTVTIPDAFADRMRAAAVPPSASEGPSGPAALGTAAPTVTGGSSPTGTGSGG